MKKGGRANEGKSRGKKPQGKKLDRTQYDQILDLSKAAKGTPVPSILKMPKLLPSLSSRVVDPTALVHPRDRFNYARLNPGKIDAPVCFGEEPSPLMTFRMSSNKTLGSTTSEYGMIAFAPSIGACRGGSGFATAIGTSPGGTFITISSLLSSPMNALFTDSPPDEFGPVYPWAAKMSISFEMPSMNASGTMYMGWSNAYFRGSADAATVWDDIQGWGTRIPIKPGEQYSQTISLQEIATLSLLTKNTNLTDGSALEHILFFAWHAPAVTINGTLGTYTPIVRLEANMCILESSTNQWIKAVTGHKIASVDYKSLDSNPVLHKSTGQVLKSLHRPIDSVIVDPEGHLILPQDLDVSVGTTASSALFTKKVAGVQGDLEKTTKIMVANRELRKAFKNAGLYDHVDEDFVEHLVGRLVDPTHSETESEMGDTNPFSEG